MSDRRLPPELERYTLSPPWQQEQQDEARRKRALHELRNDRKLAS